MMLSLPRGIIAVTFVIILILSSTDGKIFMLSEMCMLSVLEPDGGLAPVSVSDLDDLRHATPAIADGRIYVRTRNHLYAFGLMD